MDLTRIKIPHFLFAQPSVYQICIFQFFDIIPCYKCIFGNMNQILSENVFSYTQSLESMVSLDFEYIHFEKASIQCCSTHAL